MQLIQRKPGGGGGSSREKLWAARVKSTRRRTDTIVHFFMENRKFHASSQESKDVHPLNRLPTLTERARATMFAKLALSARHRLQYPFNTTSITNRPPLQECNDLPQVQRDLAAPMICLCYAADVPCEPGFSALKLMSESIKMIFWGNN